jgi:hypothetical protein
VIAMSNDPGSVHDRYANTGFVALCRDKPDGAALRQQATAAHLEYIEQIMDRLNLAGPLFDDAGQTMIGSMYCFRTKDAQEALQLLEQDPYYQAGVFESVELRPFLPAAGDYIGGKIW